MDTDVFDTQWAHSMFKGKYAHDKQETWSELCSRVVEAVVGDRLPEETKNAIKERMRARKFIPAGRYLYSAGRDFHQVNNCFLFRGEDSREGWAGLMSKITSALMTGGGIGVEYSDIRPYGADVRRTGGFATGPLSVMHMVNEAGRHIMQGGQRRSAIWAGLNWYHPDALQLLHLKNWSPELRAMKESDFNFPLPMEGTNISVGYDDLFFDLLTGRLDEDHVRHLITQRHDWLRDGRGELPHDLIGHARWVWRENCRQAFKTGEPGFSVNARNWRDNLRNACTEVTSSDDSDKCNLGTVWLNRHENLFDFDETVRLATLFLLCGNEYSHLPSEEIARVGRENNRIGLGLGGVHEWLMTRGYGYQMNDELASWLEVYRDTSDAIAVMGARMLGQNDPKGVRAIAPTGTIGILAETSTGIEPLFCAAYMRRYYDKGTWKHQYVIDGMTRRLMEKGVSLDLIEANDAYALSFHDRVEFQADVQDYVDMAISSTCNMAAWDTTMNNDENVDQKADTLMNYAERLRGFTVYPDGARGGQPLTKVYYQEAAEKVGTVFEEHEDQCLSGVCGL